MSFKTFFVTEEKKDQDYINSLIGNLHIKPENLRKAYDAVPQIGANFIDKSGKRLNSLNALVYHLGKNMKNGKITILTPDGDAAVTYTKDVRPIFKNKGDKKVYGVTRQDIINMLTQGYTPASSLGGASTGAPIA